MIDTLSYWLVVPLGVALFWALPQKCRYPFLGIASFVFIAAYELATALMMMGICLMVFWLWHPMVCRKPVAKAGQISIFVVAGYLFYFKYLPLLGATLARGYDFADLLLPIGISYFAFKLIHYAVEMARGNMPSHAFWEYLAWIFWVPIFTAGPIQRFELFLQNRTNDFDHDLFWLGIHRICQGLVKKFIVGAVALWLATELSGGGVGALLENISEISPLIILFFILANYTIIYMDFSGYSDIAIGTSMLFGIRIMENFNFPFLAPNIGNLFKRWHISLSQWCQIYIYMPMLGLTRNPYYAAVASFLVMGIWHAASWSWIAWGLHNALGACIFQWFSQTSRKRRWTFQKGIIFRTLRYPVTFLWFACSFLFAVTEGQGGVYAALQIMARMVYIAI